MEQFIVTGGSSGIGLALARRLGTRGKHLHLLGRDETKLAQAVERVAATGAQVTPHSLDLTDDEAVETFCRSFDAGSDEGLAGLVHSAGLVELGPVRKLDIASFDAHYRLNLRAPYLLTQRLLPQLEAAKGQVVFVNSGAGLNANANWSQYAASKHGLKAFADSLRSELSDSGVRVISVYPGRTASPMQKRVREMEGEAYNPATFIQPDDVASQLVSALRLPRTASVTDLIIRPA